MTWASDNPSEESLPLSSINSPHCSDDFATACTYFTTLTPSFHHTECPDEDGILPPMRRYRRYTLPSTFEMDGE